MNFVFKQAVCLDGKDYLRGVHRLSGEVLKNKTFLKFCELGLIHQEGPKAEVFIFQTLAEKNKMLADKMEASTSIIEESKAQDLEIKKSKKK